jgi:hypothetical protein
MTEELILITVEDYIDFMQLKERCGAPWHPNLTSLTASVIPPPPPPMIQFNRSDAILLRSLSGNKRKYSTKLAWTEKQRASALMLIHKYRTQLKNKFEIDITAITENPIWRDKDPRILSTVKSIILKDDYFHITCPFIPAMIEELREARHQLKYCATNVEWNHVDKIWMVEATPRALNFIDQIITKYGPFDVSTEVAEFVAIYKEVINNPAPPTVRLLNEKFVFENMTVVQQTVAEEILQSADSIQIKFWKLADCEFILDNSLRQLLPNTCYEQNIILTSDPTVSANDVSFVDLISFLDRINIGPIFITYAWSGEVVKNRIKELQTLFPNRVKVIDNFLGLQEKRPVNKYKDPSDKDLREIASIVDDVAADAIIVAKDTGAMQLNNKYPVLVSISGLIGATIRQTLTETLGFSKVIKFQPTL